MVWVFPEYGGQVAVTIGEMKAVRQGLKTKRPGDWEVYDLSRDFGEANDIASSNTQFIAQVEQVLQREVAENAAFPLNIPGVSKQR